MNLHRDAATRAVLETGEATLYGCQRKGYNVDMLSSHLDLGNGSGIGELESQQAVDEGGSETHIEGFGLVVVVLVVCLLE